MEAEEAEQGETAWFNKHHGLGSFPFSSLIFLAFVDSLVSAVVAGRNMEPSQASRRGCDMASLHAWEGG